jgi:two-component system, LytTR family, sensor kinase
MMFALIASRGSCADISPMHARDASPVPAHSTRSLGARQLLIVATAFGVLATLSSVVEHLAHAATLRELAQRMPAIATISVRQSSIPWQTTLLGNLQFWCIWAALTPLIVAAARRIARTNMRFSLVAWTLVGIASCLAHAGISVALGASAGSRSITFLTGSAASAWHSQLASASLLNVVTFGLIAGAIHATWHVAALQARRVAQAELEASLTATELQVLRMKVQPHFLFNALNTASALMLDDVPAARRVLVSLGDLLRHSMASDGKQEVSLGEEIEFTLRYVEIQNARFGGKLLVNVDVSSELHGLAVPNLLLQPLVENSIRHGIERSPGGGSVSISAHATNDELCIVVQDVLLDRPIATDAPEVVGAGTGLANLRARLELLYPNAYTLDAAATADGFLVHTCIPRRAAPVAAPLRSRSGAP